MHEMQTANIGSIVWSTGVCQSICLSVTQMTVLTHSPDGATLMQLLLYYCKPLVLYNTYDREMEKDRDLVHCTLLGEMWFAEILS